VKLDFDWAKHPDEAEIRRLKPWEHASYQFPCYGDNLTSLKDWQFTFRCDAKTVATQCQTHRHSETCRKNGTECRFGFYGEGKELVPQTVVDIETGKIEIKRGHQRANNHIPAVCSVTRSNNDANPTFTSGLESLGSTFYMTSYMCKGDDDSGDAVALESAFRDLEKEKVLTNSDQVNDLRRLMIRINYIRNSGLNFSGAQVAAMLLNIGIEGTHYTNSKFATLNFYAFVNHAKKVNVDFRVEVGREGLDDLDAEDEGDYGEFEGETDSDSGSESEDVAEVKAGDEDGSVKGVPEAVLNYLFRGEECESMSVYEMALQTRVAPATEGQISRYMESISTESSSGRQGRPWNRKSRFDPRHPKSSSAWITFRSEEHTPVIVGKQYSYGYTDGL
jgi:hypothetical protein